MSVPQQVLRYCLIVIALALLPSISIYAVGFVAIFALTCWRYPSKAPLLFGVFLPWTGAFGAGFVLIIASVFCVLVPLQRERLSLWWARYAVLLHLVWLIWFLAAEYPPWLILEVIRLHGVHVVVAQFLDGTPRVLAEARYVVTLLIGLVVFSWLSVEDRARQAVLRGVCIGSAVSGLLLLAQRLAGMSLPGQTRFWSQLGRFSGAFTDPNALGIAAFLLLGILVATSFAERSRSGRNLLRFGAVAWGALGLLSGSRSFLLGVVLFAGFLVIRFGRGNVRPRVVVSGVALVFLLVTLLITFRDFFPSIDRLMEPFNSGDWFSVIASRAFFTESAWEVFLHFPWFGVGPFRFEDWFLSVSRARHLDLGLWTDNPNNFYVGMLCEFGLLGLGVFLLTLSKLHLRRPADPTSRILRYVFLIFCILLCFGPHNRAPTVLLLSALVATTSFQAPLRTEHGVRIGAVLLLYSAILLGCIGWQIQSLPAGLYNVEKIQQRYVRWAGPVGRIVIPCIDGKTAPFEVRSSRTQTLRLWLPSGKSNTLYSRRWVPAGPFACTGRGLAIRYQAQRWFLAGRRNKRRLLSFRVAAAVPVNLPSGIGWGRD